MRFWAGVGQGGAPRVGEAVLPRSRAKQSSEQVAQAIWRCSRRGEAELRASGASYPSSGGTGNPWLRHCELPWCGHKNASYPDGGTR